MTVLTTGADNVAIGCTAFNAATSSLQCVCIGRAAGDTLTTGSNNVCIGYATDVNSTAAAGRIAIGVTSGGTPAVATVDNGLFFHTALATVAGTAVQYDAATGQMGPIVSSQRFKENIVPIELETSKIWDLRPVSFDWKADHLRGRREFGLIAEEVAELLPELVPVDEEGRPYSVNYDRLVVLLIAETKKLKERIEMLEAK
jgi:hypothetical protein